MPTMPLCDEALIKTCQKLLKGADAPATMACLVQELLSHTDVQAVGAIGDLAALARLIVAARNAGWEEGYDAGLDDG